MSSVLLRCCPAVLASLLGAASARAEDASFRANYAGYSHGLNILNLETMMALHPAGYRLEITYRLGGLIGAFVHGDGSTVVDGRFVGEQALPREMFSSGHFRGAARMTQIDWVDGSPKIVQLQPALEPDRDPVPPSEQAHTIDTLSAMAALMRRVTDTGRCESAARTFDGHRLSEITARTVGPEVLEQTGRSVFQGQALRCDFDGRQLGGFLHDEDEQVLRRPQHGSAWFARLQPNQPMIPVRITFTTRAFGDATLYLKGPS